MVAKNYGEAGSVKRECNLRVVEGAKEVAHDIQFRRFLSDVLGDEEFASNWRVKKDDAAEGHVAVVDVNIAVECWTEEVNFHVLRPEACLLFAEERVGGRLFFDRKA